MVHVKYTKIKSFDKLLTLEVGVVIVLNHNLVRYNGSINQILNRLQTSSKAEDYDEDAYPLKDKELRMVNL